MFIAYVIDHELEKNGVEKKQGSLLDASSFVLQTGDRIYHLRRGGLMIKH